MWTRANRGRMAKIEKKTKRYPTDVTDEEWERIVLFLSKPARQGRKPGVDMREVLNAIRYIARAARRGSLADIPRDNRRRRQVRTTSVPVHGFLLAQALNSQAAVGWPPVSFSGQRLGARRPDPAA